ncbi:F-box domain-containing protein [Mycena venus]|uniref:F-box domain-containing protein n=1 Tax=Mycena venus TaxID=2733690 RepID=A0A8H6YCA3_9AGAR|nr:F-box domain-containing protein [Mycena venus]
MLTALEVDRIRIADIDAQIRDLERTLAALRVEKWFAQERLDSYKYPVLTLPNEIVSEIFVHFLPPYPACPPRRGILSPTVLTQICGKWREIALATPMLWRAIKMIPDDVISATKQGYTLAMWLSRSLCCPLSIHAEEHPEYFETERFLKTVVPHRARWEHLNLLELGSSYPLLTIEGPMPQLRALQLTVDPDRLRHTAVKISFHEMPMLRTVTLNDGAIACISLPWAQLTSLTLIRVYPSECFPILQQASSLVHCRLDIFSDTDNEHPNPIRLPNLQSLALTLADVAVEGYLETFLVPALNNLEITEGFLMPNPIGSLRSFISKSGCKLHRVHITDYGAVRRESYREAGLAIQKFSFKGRYLSVSGYYSVSSDEED